MTIIDKAVAKHLIAKRDGQRLAAAQRLADIIERERQARARPRPVRTVDLVLLAVLVAWLGILAAHGIVAIISAI
jgi:hypothetical protein